MSIYKYYFELFFIFILSQCFNLYRYRGKIISLVDDTAEVSYVDYGDRRVIQQSDIRRIHPEFLKLRFQAIQATLNLG